MSSIWSDVELRFGSCDFDTVGGLRKGCALSNRDRSIASWRRCFLFSELLQFSNEIIVVLEIFVCLVKLLHSISIVFFSLLSVCIVSCTHCGAPVNLQCIHCISEKFHPSLLEIQQFFAQVSYSFFP